MTSYMLKFPINWKRYQKLYAVLATVIILALTFGAGTWYGYERRPAIERITNVINKEPPVNLQKVDFNLFWDVWRELENKYVDKDKIDRQKLVYGAIQGLVGSLKDPYTEFFPPKETKQFQDDIKGYFEGIGAEIGVRKGVLTIIAPLKGSPAEQAGLKAGDKILKINDTLTGDLALDEAVRLIRGPKGEAVRLLIFRDVFAQPREFKIVRDTIHVQILSTAVKPEGIFVIKLNHFTENSPLIFRNAAEEFLNNNSRKLILDLRNDPGGFLSAAVDIASWFAPAGETVVRERYADGSEDLFRSRGYKLFEDIPTVVLINEGSASASEIVAGALRDLRGVKLIGTKTFGKGSVQEVENLEQGSSIKITIAKWLTPHGEEINGKGLEPDIKVEPLPEDKNPEMRDPVMEKALEVLK